jgi:hypothetical protein
MITFLRKIRKSLLMSGSTKKYILYAVGEIALVVFGILIALQINNWNENRKSNKLVKSHLETLKEDLMTDLDQIQFNLNFLDEKEESGRNVWNFLYETSEEAVTKSLNEDFLQLQLFREFAPARTAYDNFINSGVINFLNNSDLQNLLSNYYKEDPFGSRSSDQRSRLTNEYDPYRIKYIPSGMLRDYLNHAIFEDSTFNNKHYEIDWKNLKNDEEYKFLLDQILAMRVPARWVMLNFKTEIDEILSKIIQTLASN